MCGCFEGSDTTDFCQCDSESLGMFAWFQKFLAWSQSFQFTKFGNACHMINNYKVLQEY